MRKKTTENNKNSKIRLALAREAARLMYEEGVAHYLDAKKIAAKRLFGSGGANAMRYRPQDLPSNGEIALELAKLVELYEDDQMERLAAMRKTAVHIMAVLTPFHPRLIGSVSTGRVRKGSDIDLHVFTDSLEELENHLQRLQWRYDKKNVVVRRGNRFIEYTHVYVEADFPVELSVYPLAELRIAGRSSTDSKRIKRLKITDVERL
ncbi:MAG: nucleotidyltransferase domain-containing protein [Gammaproteobacteria bacterium]